MSSPSNLACPMTQPVKMLAANTEPAIAAMISCFFIGLPFLVDDACIIEGGNGCTQDTFFAICVSPLILAAEVNKKVFCWHIVFHIPLP